MAVETTQEIQRFAFEGPLSTTQAIVVGCVLAALAFWALFRVPKAAPQKYSWLLWTLRAGAIAILIWMLLGPVNVTTYRHETPKSLAIMYDVSESMNAFDPPDDKAVAHWRAVENGDSAENRLLAACDRAAVAAGAAHDTLDRVLRDPQAGAPGKESQRQLEIASKAAADAVKLSNELSGLLESGGDEFTGEFLSRSREISSSLEAANLDDISSIAKKAGGQSFTLEPDDRGRLEEFRRELAQGARALAGLSDRFATKMTSAGSGKPPGANASQSSLARSEQVNRLLENASKTWLAKYDQTAKIHRYTFGRETASVADAVKAGGAEVEKKSVSEKEQKSVAAGSEKGTRGAFTNISAALERIGQDAAREKIEAAILFTDGRHNDPAARDPRDVAKLVGSVPFHIVPVGTSQMQKDLILHRLEVPTAVVQNDEIVIESILSAFDCAGETAMLELTEGKNLVDRQEINVASIRRDYHIRFSVPAKEIGRHEYTLTVAPVAGEVVPTNNAQSFGVDVVDAKMKVLLADDFPRWEYRYLINLFERSERIEYDQLLLHPSERSTGQLAGPPANQLPHDVEGWSKYRVAILGDLPAEHFSEESQNALKDFVAVRGGTVIVVAGTQAMPQGYAGMPFADLIPVTAAGSSDPTQGYQLELSAEGKLTSAMQIADEPGMSEQVWKDMSRQLPVYSLSQYCIPKPTARTLIEAQRTSGASDGEQRAFLCWQTVGRGRVIYIAAPTIYQLRMKYGDRYHHRFWGQLIRWSIAKDISQGSKTVKLAADRSRVAVGDMLQVIANLSTVDGQPVLDAQVRAEAKMDGTSTSLVELKADPNIPGRYLGEYAPTAEGALTLQAFGPDVTQLLEAEGYKQSVETAVTVDPTPSTETEDTRSNTPLLRQIAGLTGGQVVPPTAVDEIVALTDLQPHIEEQTVRGPLWNRWIYLWLITGLLTIEWAVRKSTGRP